MQGKNKPLLRYLEARLCQAILNKQSALVLGPRQVGKTTLLQKVLVKKKNLITYYLQDPSVRLDVEKDPSLIIREAQGKGGNPHVFIDEAQKVPEVFDASQVLIDNKEAHMYMTGSSARKLRRSGTNLLPGRIQKMSLDPLLWGEVGLIRDSSIPELAMKNINSSIPYSLEDILVFGSLPAMVRLSQNTRKNNLKSYAELYIEEEIRAEALSRKIGAFSRFLELAANESGTAPNFTKLSNESGVSQPTIKEYYNILEDTLIVERIDPYLKNARKRILATSRYYFFDIGVRNALAHLPLETNLINAQKGVLFEHAVILEIIRRIRALNKEYSVHYWRTSGGAEVDCVIDTKSSVIPLEIKSSARVSLSELKGLRNFLDEYKSTAKQGYVITMGKRKEKLADNIIAIPWCQL